MKRVLLHIALVLAVLYGITAAVIILGQKSFREIYLQELSDNGLIIPMPDIVKICLLVILAVIFWVLLKDAGDYAECGREMAAVILFFLIIVFGPAADKAITAFQSINYGRMGALMIADYSVLNSTMQTASPLIRASMILMQISASISLGEKKKISRS